MLVLSRECDTSVWIGPNVKVKILSIQKRRVKLGIEAPAGIQVWRDEIIGGSNASHVIYEEPPRGTVLEGPSPVMLVEDDPDHAILISRTLSEVCLTAPVIAETGGAALELLDRASDQPESSVQPRLVVLDLRLPDMSGLDVLREIRSRPELTTMPVVILSAEQSDTVVTSCLEAGANAFVTKAADYEHFRNSIRRLAVFWGGECRIPVAEGRETRAVRAK
jgi:two-component system response regulator